MKSPEQKLEEVVQLAINNGFMIEELGGIAIDKIQFMAEGKRVRWGLKSINKYFIESSVYGLLFSHAFAKAVFQKGWTCFYEGKWQDCKESEGLRSDRLFFRAKYEFHLREAVVTESPLDYYHDFILKNQ